MAAQDYQLLLAETNDDRLIETPPPAGTVGQPGRRAWSSPRPPEPHEDSVNLLRDMPHVQLLRKHPSLGSQWFGLDDHRSLRRCHRAPAASSGTPGSPTSARRPNCPPASSGSRATPKRCVKTACPAALNLVETGPAVVLRARPGGRAPAAEPADPADRRGPGLRPAHRRACSTGCWNGRGRAERVVGRRFRRPERVRLVGARADHDQPADQRRGRLLRAVVRPPAEQSARAAAVASPTSRCPLGSLVLRGSTAATSRGITASALPDTARPAKCCAACAHPKIRMLSIAP